jgi:hypothetical protein
MTDQKNTTNEEVLEASKAFLDPKPNPNAKPLTNEAMAILLLFLANKHYGAKE